MKKFVTPEMKIIYFEEEDIITASPTDPSVDPGPDEPGLDD